MSIASTFKLRLLYSADYLKAMRPKGKKAKSGSRRSSSLPEAPFIYLLLLLLLYITYSIFIFERQKMQIFKIRVFIALKKIKIK